ASASPGTGTPYHSTPATPAPRSPRSAIRHLAATTVSKSLFFVHSWLIAPWYRVSNVLRSRALSGNAFALEGFPVHVVATPSVGVQSAAAASPERSCQRHDSRGKIIPGVLSVVMIGATLSPVVENWREKPTDSFPLSYYPMFSQKRA